MSKKSYVFPTIRPAAADLSSNSVRGGENRAAGNTDHKNGSERPRIANPVGRPKQRRRGMESDEEDDEAYSISRTVGVVNRGTKKTFPEKKVARKSESESEDQSSAEEEYNSAPDDDESDRNSALEAQLEAEDEDSAANQIKRKRLPELDFVLAFAHKRVRELLRNSDEDDQALQYVFATWLNEIENRFQTFEKQAAKFDEFESALLQSQRMHQKYRKMIGAFLKEERQIKRALSDTIVLNERRKRGQREAQKADELFRALTSAGL